MTLWHGRFDGGPADELMAYTASLSFDRRLAGDDVVASRAHVAGLHQAGLLDRRRGRRRARRAGHLRRRSWSTGTFVFEPTDEDIHTAIERRVTELAGPAGAKLHTGRSRNDQVATGLRLWCKRELRQSSARVVGAAGRAPRAGRRGRRRLPARATPTCSGPSPCCWPTTCWPTAGRWPATSTACSPPIARLDVSPARRRRAGRLVAAARPRRHRVHGLGFATVFENSLDAVSDRDFVAEALFDLALLGVHLSRLGEEWVLWTSEEFGFARLDDAYATGSSMLPQKKNPDIAELARGKAGRLIGHLAGLPRHAEGPAARLQPRPAGGQGAAVRRRRAGAAWPSARSPA